MKYLDTEGNVYFVGQGIGGADWFTLRRKPGKNSAQRVKTPALPLRRLSTEAQSDLDAWAPKKKLVAKEIS